MPVEADLLELLLRRIEPGSPWHATLIGRGESGRGTSASPNWPTCRAADWKALATCRTAVTRRATARRSKPSRRARNARCEIPSPVEEGLQPRLRTQQVTTKAGKCRILVFKGRGDLVAGLNPRSSKAMLDAADDDPLFPTIYPLFDKHRIFAPMKPIRSVTIDLDGTLLDTIPDLAAAANAMMRELGRPEHAIDTIASFVGRGIPNLVGRCLPDLAGQPLAQAQDIFRRHYATENGRCSKLYPGVLDGLRAFRDAGLPMAVITNKAAAFTEPLLLATQLASWFEFAVSGDSLPEKKPHPLPLLHACERLGSIPAENLHIGDSRHDAAAARAAGCPVFLVPYGYNEGEDVQGIDCDAIVASLVEAESRVAGQQS